MTSEKKGNFSDFERSDGVVSVFYKLLIPWDVRTGTTVSRVYRGRPKKRPFIFAEHQQIFKCEVTIEQIVESMCRPMQESLPVCLKSLGQNESGKHSSSICLAADLFDIHVEVERRTSSDWTCPSPSGSLPYLSEVS